MHPADRLPVTYRQYDHWLRRGYIRCASNNPGSGHSRPHLDELEEQVLFRMAALVADGVRPARAAEAARELVLSGSTTLGGLTLREVPS